MMLRTLKLLKSSTIVKNYEILDFKKGKDFYYLKIKVILEDNSELYIREFVSKSEYLYSYHWQNVEGKIIIRWDNAPHYKHHETFSHHKHTPEIKESEEANLEDVLKVIENSLENVLSNKKIK